MRTEEQMTARQTWRSKQANLCNIFISNEPKPFLANVGVVTPDGRRMALITDICLCNQMMFW
jgi:hypothetical protein